MGTCRFVGRKDSPVAGIHQVGKSAGGAGVRHNNPEKDDQYLGLFDLEQDALLGEEDLEERGTQPEATTLAERISPWGG